MSPEKQPRVYVVVLNWNGWRDTVPCLESVFALDYAEVRVVVCDNGSTDGSIAKITEWAASRNIAHVVVRADVSATVSDVPLVVIDVGENRGYAGANNVGLELARARGDFAYVWLLNNDTAVDPKSLSFLVEKMKATGAGLGGSTLVFFDDRAKAQALGGGTFRKWVALPRQVGATWRPGVAIDEDSVARKLAYVSGAAMLVSKAFLDDVGLLYEGYFLYCEELDWATRGRSRHRLAYASRSIVYHKEGASTGTTSETSEYYYARARVLFTKRHHRRALPTTMLAITWRAIGRALRGETKLARAIVAAGIDGLRGREGMRRR